VVPRAVILDCAVADTETSGDLFAGQGGRHEVHDFALARRQLTDALAVQLALAIFGTCASGSPAGCA
jgi:hypothetical protein